MVETLAKLEIPGVEDQEAFNLERWREVLDDPDVAKVEGRVETNRFGEIIMTPPPGYDHSERQGEIFVLLRQLTEAGKVLPECPISTDEGVRAADVVWISDERLQRSRKEQILTLAPEICVEVLSPRNRKDEIEEKVALYFEAGADEVWICDLEGKMLFFLAEEPGKAGVSKLCPEFPTKIE